MATDKTQGLPHVAAATAAEIAAAAIAPFVQKRLASLTRSREACEAELKIVSQSRYFMALRIASSIWSIVSGSLIIRFFLSLTSE